MGYEKAVLIPEGQSKEIKVQFNPCLLYTSDAADE